jgi:REP element-mobilizing transposase RayT
MPPTIALSDSIQALKGSSSKILKTVEGFEKFKAWSEDYAALSNSMDDRDKIVKYIINQQEHHKKVTFREEYESFIRDNGTGI